MFWVVKPSQEILSRIYNLSNSSSEQQCDCVVYKFLVSLRRMSRVAGSKIASRARAKGGGTLSAGGTSSEPTPVRALPNDVLTPSRHFIVWPHYHSVNEKFQRDEVNKICRQTLLTKNCPCDGAIRWIKGQNITWKLNTTLSAKLRNVYLRFVKSETGQLLVMLIHLRFNIK